MATSKQTKAIIIYKKNYGSGITPTEAMRQAGYAESSLKNPKVLTESLDWQEAMDKFLPDMKLLEKHNQLMEAKKIERAEFPLWLGQEKIKEILEEAGCQPRNFEINPVIEVIHVWYWAPDTAAQSKALELAYKLKKKMGADVNVTLPPPTALVEFLGGEESTPGQSPIPQ